MEKERISVFQLVVLLYVCRSFNLFTATLHDVGAGYGAVQLAAYPLAAVFQLALMLPVWLLTRFVTGPENVSLVWWPLALGEVVTLMVALVLYNKRAKKRFAFSEPVQDE